MRTIGSEVVAERENYQRYLCSREWAVLKEAVRERCGGICERCHLNPMDHVHHLIYARKYHERLEDLQAQCIGCHEFTHGKRDRDPILDAPARICGRQIDSVYLAGRITGCDGDWRQEIIPDWYAEYGGIGRTFGVGDEDRDGFARLPDGREIEYSGPYWLDVYGGHGLCGLGPHAFADDDGFSGHGAGLDGGICSISDPVEVARYCRDCLLRADLVFAWLDSRECLGTLVEIGWAMTAGKVVAVAMPQWDRELWLACAAAHRFVMATTAGKAWEWMWKHPDLTHKLGAVRDTTGPAENDR